MKCPIAFLMLLGLCSGGLAHAVDEAPGEIALFNGENLDNWKLFLPDAAANPAETWSVKDGILRCTGTPAGYMRTKEVFEDFELRFQYRWPGEGGNNGVLFHVQEPDMVWPKSFEGQMYHENAGDIYVIEGSDINERTDKEDRRVKKLEDSSEKPLGEWNDYRVVAKGDTFELYVNGVLQNRATGATLTSGYIAFQSEGAPIEYRNIVLKPL